MINYLAQPNTIEPVYSNLVFQFSSTGATDPSKYKYRYVVDVFVSEGSDEEDGQIAQLKITPSSDGWGQVDISPILRNYTHSKPVNVGCSGNTTPLHTSAWGYLNTNMIVYSIKVGEEYSTTENGIVFTYDGYGDVGSPDVRSNVCYSYNGVKEWFNGKNYDFTPYHLTGSTDFNSGVCRYMTNSPRSRWIRTGDYSTLAALNYFSATTEVDSRQVYSAKFTFYDEDNNIISTQRTYNVYDLCGTRPYCNYYDYWFNTPTNFAEQQVIYLGVGTPNIEEHGMSFPSLTKYYKVELEATLDSPAPDPPEPYDFDGCSCWEYQLYNPSLESLIEIEYLNCTGGTSTISISPESTGNWCACQNTNTFLTSPEYTITGITECDACICLTYRVANSDPDFPAIFTYVDCDGAEQTGSVEPDDFVDVCACEDSISAGGMFVSELGVCPQPFSANCRTYVVDTNVGYVLDITYTGCCGTEITISLPPSVSVPLCANDPFPTSILWNSLDIGSCVVECPPTPEPPTPTSISTGDNIVGRNLCDNSLMYFSYTGETIYLGQYINYQNVAYEIVLVGGGGFVPLYYPFVFDTEAQVLASFPCYSYSSDSCLDTQVISEPFYFYLDGICSQGDRVVYFMNKMGTWDSYNFRSKEDKGYGIQKEEYKQSPPLYYEGWSNDSYYGWNERRSVWSQLVSKSGILYTDYMPQSEMLWLSEELFQSPSVYLIGDDGVLEPITLTNTEVVVPNYQVGSNKYQINIEYKSGYDTIRQNHE